MRMETKEKKIIPLKNLRERQPQDQMILPKKVLKREEETALTQKNQLKMKSRFEDCHVENQQKWQMLS